MPKQKTAKRQFVGHMKVTRTEEWLVEAESEEEARQLLEGGDAEEERSLEMTDWDVLKIEDTGEA